MRILIGLWHPAHVHTFRNVIKELNQRGHEIKVVAIEKDITLDLLDLYDIDYKIIGESGDEDLFNISKGVNYLKITHNLWKVSKDFNPDLLFARASSMMAHVSNFLQIPYVSFFDSDITSKTDFLNSLFDVVFTPELFKKDLENAEHIKLPTYKELAYLHPNNFNPDNTLPNKIGLETDEKFCLLRFVGWEAWHDVGKKGFDADQKRKLVEELKKHCKVFISTESDLPPDLEQQELDIPLNKIHDLLYHADLFLSDSQTMSTEAAILGTPSVRHNAFVGQNDMSNFIELSEEYNLLYNVDTPEKAINKSLELIKDHKAKKRWQMKRKKLLKDKIDLTKFFIWFIENYPESLDKLKENENIIWEVGT